MSEKTILFDTGFVVRTPGAFLALLEADVSETWLIERHQSGDFGQLCEEDRQQNLRALEAGGRILSRYVLRSGVVWVITEADREVTTVLLPSEY
jgi:hypothetical protein